ncbi:MAG TPA: hypothetical protein VNK67_03910 [Burkholderiales bacterium]|nr:hypothetical protein [Burkholderiales bacterium]
MESIAQVLFLIGLATWLGWVLARRYFYSDFKDPDQQPAPTDQQLRWHIWNIRQDLSLVAVTNFAILLVLVYVFVLKL